MKELKIDVNSTSAIYIAKKLLSTTDRIGLYEKMADYLDEGISLDNILLTLSQEYLGAGFLGFDSRGVMLYSWFKDIESGIPLSKAMMPWIPPSEFMLIQAGEESGTLSQAFKNAVTATSAVSGMIGAVIAAMAYPVMLLVILIMIVVGFSLFAVPMLTELKDPSTWPSASQSLYTLSQIVVHKWWLISLSFILLVTVVAWSMKNLSGDIRKYLDKIPPWNMYRAFQSSIFLISVSAMMKTGKPIFESIDQLNAASSKYVSSHLRVILGHLNSGSPTGKSLCNGFFSKETEIDIKISSKTSNIEGSMEIIGRKAIKSSISTINAISSIVKTLAMIFVAGFIFWIYYAFHVLTQSMSSGLM